MAETAVGLFEDKLTAHAAVNDLMASGFPAEGIRIVVEPEWLPVVSITSTPHAEFQTELQRDLVSMGVSEANAEAYVESLRHGHALVFATGSLAQANTAVNIMNDHYAIELEEFPAEESVLTGGPATNLLMHNAGTNDAGTHESIPRSASARIAQSRAKREGARIFAW